MLHKQFVPILFRYCLWYFMKITEYPFFSSSRSWSDSEVPLIESEIKFLQILLGEISGVDYLEHRLYLKEQINYKKQYKQEILKREYLQNFAYN